MMDDISTHLRLRVSHDLYERLCKSAAKNGRTMTGEIIDRIEVSFKRDEIRFYVDELARRISEKL